MSRKPDPLEIRCRELCEAIGIDPDSRIALPGKERGMPAWCGLFQCTIEEHRCMRRIGVDSVLAECQRISKR